MEELNPLQKETEVCNMIEEIYPRESWLQVYTDGSATQAVRNGGAVVFVLYPDLENQATCLPMGTFCSNYNAETKTLTIATETIQDSEMPTSCVSH
jgi:ribonuclease HI